MRLLAVLTLVCACTPRSESPAETAETRAPRAPAGTADEPGESPAISERASPRGDATFGAPVAVRGITKNGKGGAVLLVGAEEYPVYVATLNRWPVGDIDQERAYRGRLARLSHLPEAKTLPGGVVTQGVQPGSMQWVFLDGAIVDRVTEPEAVPLDLFAAANPEHAACVAAIEAALTAGAESPDDFLIGAPARHEATGRYQLWHRTALGPESRQTNGNPGGRSRDAVCTSEGEPSVQFEFWQ